MVLEGSTTIRGVIELSNTMATHCKTNIPKNLYLITDGGGDRKVINVSVETALIALFLKHDMDEIIACRTTSGLSYRNPVERVHLTANLDLQRAGLMRQVMGPDKERLITNLNSNEEIRKVCKGNEEQKKALAESVKVPTQLLANIFSELSLKVNKFNIIESATDDELKEFNEILLKYFDEKITDLIRKVDLEKFPKFKKIYDTHCSRHTYYFHIFNRSSSDCPYHVNPLGEPIQTFHDPIPDTDPAGVEHYKEGKDSNEKFVPSKLIDAKKNNKCPFSHLRSNSFKCGNIPSLYKLSSTKITLCSEKSKKYKLGN